MPPVKLLTSVKPSSVKMSTAMSDMPPPGHIVTICPGGGMSLIAVDIMVDAGFKSVKSLTGGMELWVEKGYPTTNISESNL